MTVALHNTLYEVALDGVSLEGYQSAVPVTSVSSDLALVVLAARPGMYSISVLYVLMVIVQMLVAA